MSNFTSLKNYHIPSDLLIEMLSTYKVIGLNDTFKEKLKDKVNSYFSRSLESDAFALCEYLKIDVSKDRLRLIITKNSTPRNLQETRVQDIKKMLARLRSYAKADHSFNSVDILDCLKKALGTKDIRFKDSEVTLTKNKGKSLRFALNKALDEYEQSYLTKEFEPIALGVIAVMELYNISPYTKGNELAAIIMYYYYLLRSNAECFLYIGFFKDFLAEVSRFFDLIQQGSVNYDQGSLYFTDLAKYTFNKIQISYNEVKKLLAEAKIRRQAFKSDIIEQGIIEELPTIFSKEDVRKKFPTASDSTIKRVLERLTANKSIIALGTGRSAKYQKLLDPNSLEYLTGAKQNDED